MKKVLLYSLCVGAFFSYSYALTPEQIKEKYSSMIMTDEQPRESMTLIPESNLVTKKDELCNFSQKRIAECNEIDFSFDSLDIEFNEDEVRGYQESISPSPLVVFAREIGISLLLRGIAVKDFIGNVLVGLKNIILR